MKSRVGGSLIYFLIVVMLLVMRISGSVGIYDALGVDSDAFFTSIVQLCCFGLLSVLGWWIIVGRCKKDQIGVLAATFYLKKCSIKHFGFTLLITVPLLLVTGAVSYVWNGVLSATGFQHPSSTPVEQTVANLFVQIVLTAVLPGIFEELTHRGLVLGTLRENGWRAVPMSALLFALMHQYIPQTGYTFVLGLALAALTFYTGSIFPAMLVHFFNNFVSVISDFDGLVPAFGVIDAASGWLYGTLLGNIVVMLAAAASVALAAVVLNRIRSDGVEKGLFPKNSLTPAAEGALPLHRDFALWGVIAIGVAATVFSFVWRI